MNQKEANVIAAATRVQIAVDRDGIDPLESRLAIAELCGAVKAAYVPRPLSDPECVTCGGDRKIRFSIANDPESSEYETEACPTCSD